MCCHRNRDAELLSVAFDALFAWETCIAYGPDGGPLPAYADKGIAIIAAARSGLMIANDHEESRDFLFSRREYFDRYDDIILLKHVADEIGWKTWKTDLEQWMLNLDKVGEFFQALNHWALGSIRH